MSHTLTTNRRRFVTFWGLITALAMVVASTAPVADAARPIPSSALVAFPDGCHLFPGAGDLGVVQLPSNGPRIGSWTATLYENGNFLNDAGALVGNGDTFRPRVTNPDPVVAGIYEARIEIWNTRGTRVLYTALASTTSDGDVCARSVTELVWTNR